MSDARILRFEDIPCWYEISFDKDKRLLFNLHKDFLEKIVLKKDHILIKSLIEEKKFKYFSDDFNADFGFEGCMKNQGERDNFKIFAINIPETARITGEKCHYCKGSGKDDLLDEKCISCSGTGEEVRTDWGELIQIACTLDILTRFLENGRDKDKETSSKKNQLLSLSTIYREGPHGGSLDGEVSPCFAAWLEILGDGYVFKEAIENMMYAEKTMFERHADLWAYHFKALIRGKNGLHLEVPGNATGLYSESLCYYEGKGYDLSCHNVDTPAQQLELIIGLATICDKYREANQQRASQRRTLGER